LHGVEEVDGTKDVAVISHCGGSLAESAEVVGELIDVAGTVEEGVIGVKMKVGELCCHTSMLSPIGVRKMWYRIGWY
jgi:hypothetical protein